MTYSHIEPLSRFVAGVAFAIWLAIEPCQGQSKDIAFGTVRRIKTSEEFEYAKFFVGLKENSNAILRWTMGRREMSLVVLDTTLSPLSVRHFVAPIPFDNILTADVNNDGKTDLILVDRLQKILGIVTALTEDTLRLTQRIDLGFEPINVLIGDLNNDKFVDIVPLDIRMLGTIPFMNDRAGHFKPGRVIAPDNGISDLVVTNLNNDRFSDIVLYDWVKSELHFLYGVGQGRFLDQTVFPVEGEVGKILVLEKSETGMLDFLLVMKKPLEIQYWEGNELGDFKKKSVLSLTARPVDVAVADVNGDRFKDVLLLFAGHLDVYFGSNEDPFAEKLQFSAPDSSSQMLVSDLNGDQRFEALVVEKGSQIAAYLNAGQSNVLKDSLEFVVGKSPSAVWIGDVNFDDIADIAVVNKRSNSISFLMGRTAHGLLGQSSFPVSIGPTYLSFHSALDSSSNFLISYPASKSLSFFSFNPYDNSAVNAVIPTDGESEVLPSQTMQRGSIDFFCSNAASATQDASLSYYLSIAPKTFLERSFRLAGPDALLGVTVSQQRQTGGTELTYLYRTTENRNLELAVAILDSSLEVKERMIAHEFPAMPDRKAYLWTADLDNDDTLDVVLSLPHESAKLYVLRATMNNAFEEEKLVLDNVTLSDRLQLQIVDANNDGLPDIVVHNQSDDSIGWLRNEGKMSFSPLKRLVQAEPGSHFFVGDVNGDRVVDMAVTYPRRGTVQILNGSLLWTK